MQDHIFNTFAISTPSGQG